MAPDYFSPNITTDDGDDSPLPPLRQDLTLSRSWSGYNGDPAWILYDPLRNSYFRLSHDIFHLLSIWRGNTVQGLQHSASRLLGRRVSDDEISDTLKFLFTHQLTDGPAQDGYRYYSDRRDEQRKSIFHRIFHNYLFFRLPLFRPQKFLDFTWHFVSPFFTRTFAFVLILLGVLSIYLLLHQWDVFIHQFINFLSWQGIFYYGVSLIFVKILHELGHAYMAKKYNVDVPIIGVAFLVLFPVLYTDTSNAWRLSSRARRLLIDAGGIFVELSIAIIATLLWVFCPDGPIRAVLFSMATLSWVLSLLINLNPFMRFDGYYIFSDFLGFENMQSRGFAMGRWRMRELLFGVCAPKPEVLPRWLEYYSIIYAWLTWIYRLFLFLGIAFLIYSFFIKLIAIILFIAELLFFIFLPIFRELKEWWSMRTEIFRSFRGKLTLCFFILFLFIFFLPLSSRVSIPALLHAGDEISIYPPLGGKLLELRAYEGQWVSSGDVLASFSSRDLQLSYDLTQKRISLLERRVARSGTDVYESTHRHSLITELATERKTAESQKAQLDRLRIISPMDGIVVDVSPEIHSSRYISKNLFLFRIRSHDSIGVTGYIPESSMDRLSQGAQGVFYPDDYMRPSVSVRLVSVALTSSTVLSDRDHSEHYGGRIASRIDSDGSVIPIAGYYRAVFTPTSDSPASVSQTQRGVILLDAERRSFAGRVLRRIYSVLIRESGF